MPQPSLKPIRRSPLYEQVVERICEFIDAQNLEAGDRLMSERDIARQLDVSRTSVRQALTALRVTGLVEIRHGEGVYLLRPPEEVIRSLAKEILLSDEHLPAIHEAREVLEPYIVRLAASRRKKVDLGRISTVLAEIAATINAGDDGESADRRFHDAITAAAHNPILSQFMRQLADPISQTRSAALARPEWARQSLAVYELVFDAIRDQDEELASRHMSEYLRLVAEFAQVHEK